MSHRALAAQNERPPGYSDRTEAWWQLFVLLLGWAQESEICTAPQMLPVWVVIYAEIPTHHQVAH